MNDKSKEQKGERKEEKKEFRKTKIQEIEQDEEIICTVNKDSNISSADLITQKERRKKITKIKKPWLRHNHKANKKISTYRSRMRKLMWW